jgi:hypothetical protein
MGHYFVVDELIAGCQLKHTVKDEDLTPEPILENYEVLVLSLDLMQHFVGANAWTPVSMKCLFDPTGCHACRSFQFDFGNANAFGTTRPP